MKHSKIITILCLMMAVVIVTSTFGVALETGDMEGEGSADLIIINDDPIGDYIWLDVNGDSLDDGGEIGQLSSSEPGNKQMTMPPDVDEIFIASDNGEINRKLFIGSTLPLQIVGTVRVTVESGEKNLIDYSPYFEYGFGKAEDIAFSILAVSTAFVLKTINLLKKADVVANLLPAAVYILTMTLNSLLEKLEDIGADDEWFDWLEATLIINGVPIDIDEILDGLLQTVQDFVGSLERIFKNLADSRLDILKNFIKKDLGDVTKKGPLFDFLVWIITPDGLLLGVACLILATAVGGMSLDEVEKWISSHPLLEGAINYILKSKDITIDYILSQIKTVHNAITDLFHIPVAVFWTNGLDSKSATGRLHISINPDYDTLMKGNYYAAKIRIDASSAGQVFDSRVVGIMYDNSKYNGTGTIIGGTTESTMEDITGDTTESTMEGTMESTPGGMGTAGL